MLMMQTKVKITLKEEFNTVLELNLKLRTNFLLLLRMHMMQTKGKITLRVEFNIVLELNLK